MNRHVADAVVVGVAASVGRSLGDGEPQVRERLFVHRHEPRHARQGEPREQRGTRAGPETRACSGRLWS